jgi:Tfp pilus assembly protein PilF
MLLLLLRRALRAPRVPKSLQDHADVYAAISALLFCIHPLASEIVLYTSQRSEALVALCYLATLYLLVRDADALRQRATPFDSRENAALPAPEAPRDGAASWLWVLVVGLCGAASKEVFATAPFVALCFDRAFIAGSFARALRVRKRFYLALCPSLLLLGLLQVSDPRPDSVRFAELDYLLAQAEIVPRYFAVALWPARLSLDYGPLWPDTAAPAWPWCVGSALALIGCAAWVLARPRAGFLALFIFSCLAPSSSLFSIHTEVGAERRFYLPLAVLISYLVLAGGTAYFGSWQRRWSRGLLIALLAATLLALGSRTRTRALDYASLRQAWQVAVATRPGNARAHYNLAETYRRERDPQAAVREYEAALALHESYPDAHSNLGGVLLARGEIARALQHTARAARLAPESAQVRLNHGIALGLSGDPSAAVGELRAAARLRPNDLELRVKLATALAIAGQRDEARAIARQVLTRRPGHSAALRVLRSLD